MSQLNNPHDKFFKETFSRLEIVQSFIEETFPVEIREKINLPKLKKTNSSFTDADLSEHLADIVYQTEYAGQQALVSLLFEHKSYPEKYPHLQLLRYMNNVWLEEQKQNKQLSVVISTVIYHGEAHWKKLSMIAYFGNPHESLHQFIPQFDYLLFSLNEIEDYQIENFKNDLLSVTTMLMKHSRDKSNNFLNLAPFLVNKLNALDAAHQDDFIKTTFRYIEEGISLTQNKLSPIFTKVSQNVNNIAMTIADEIREETTFNNIKSLLQNGASIELISKSFGISVQKIEEIMKKLKSSSN
ncbi:Rpn family recombination-promoting nuclease/putative transposase [Arcicella sp. DC2W]|uniref:Rpn family recombination-promoting nuclease/putative transposase n=1 Tax=Arcicella gelida TaxID=2984195 RepID=A0ABU5S7U8_9BACT|nr:Rpn family recombination-promoting nuclease/putative transposase [Arcicella sp. DC2W]MEA5404298.1 Rpn family recombination-promoting nuclease/putative transposase [Arcicella sp. DC2W]